MQGLKTIKANLFHEPHIEAIVSLVNEYIEDDMGGGIPLNRRKQEDLIENLQLLPNAIVFLATLGNKIVGVSISFYGFSTFHARKLINVHDLVVSKDYRGMGIGKALLESIISEAKENNCCKVTLEVREDNEKAIKLYKSVGINELNPPMNFFARYFL